MGQGRLLKGAGDFNFASLEFPGYGPYDMGHIIWVPQIGVPGFDSLGPRYSSPSGLIGMGQGLYAINLLLRNLNNQIGY